MTDTDTSDACVVCGEPIPAASIVDHLKTEHPDNLQTAAEVPRPRKRMAFEEGKPWVRYVGWPVRGGEPTTHLNPSSYEYLAVVACVEWACELIDKHNREAAAETGTFVGAPAVAQVKTLARYLLQASDLAQRSLRPDGQVDRMASSHTRARGAVRSAMWMFPVPWGEPEEEKQAWVKTLADYAVALLTCALDLLEQP